MGFSDEIKKLQRTLRCYLRYSVGPGSDNPGVSGASFDRRYGKAADNSGDVPIKGTVQKFGTFSRALTNANQDFEIPTITSELLDPTNEWRVAAARPWQLINRFVYYVLRVRQDDGTFIDSDVAWGQVYQPRFPPPGRAQVQVQMLPGDYLGTKTPKRRVSLSEWADADPSAVGQVVPTIYGKMDNMVGAVENFGGTLHAPSGRIAPVLAGSLTTGGSGQFGTAGYYYVACAVDGGIVSSPISNVVGPFAPDAVNNAVQLTITAGYTPSGWRIFFSYRDDFGQFSRYRDSGGPYSENDLPGGTTALLVTYPGITLGEIAEDPQFDLNYRQTVYYYLSAIIGSQEQAAAGPVSIGLWPINKSGQAVTVSWSEVTNATELILRRASQSYHFAQGYDREWHLPADATTFTDFFTDTSVVTLPENFARPRAGALQLLYVDTNPAGQAGNYKYLVAGHGCYRVRQVYVHKATVNQSGNPVGAIDRPRGLSVTVTGVPGATSRRYVVSASNGVGETLASNEVRVSNGNATPSPSNYDALIWEVTSGAVTYTVYVADETGDFARLANTTANQYFNDGSGTIDTTTRPPEVNTTGTNYAGGSQTSADQPILQSEGTDYFVEKVTINGQDFQIVRFNAAQEGHIVTANVWGVEDTGTATGLGTVGTLIENIVEQFLHFLLNSVFNSFQGYAASGGWFTETGYKAGLLDFASFVEAATVAATRIAGGYIGAGALTEETDIRTAIQDWLTSADLDWYFWDGKFKVRMFDPTIADPSVLTQYTPRESIFKESFEPELDVTRHYNKTPWQAGPQYDGYFISGSEKDDTSIRDYGRTIEAPVLTMPWTRHLATATDVAQRANRLSKNPPIFATFATPLKALNDEIGTLISVTHPDGIETVSTGWSQRVCKIVRSDIDFDRCVVYLRVLDVDALIATLGYVYYGDRNFDVADKSYATASADFKSTYAYLANRTTGRFNNGDAAKKYGSRP